MELQWLTSCYEAEHWSLRFGFQLPPFRSPAERFGGHCVASLGVFSHVWGMGNMMWWLKLTVILTTQEAEAGEFQVQASQVNLARPCLNILKRKESTRVRERKIWG